MTLRIGIRTKLAFLSLFLFAIPWLGYQYVQEMERYLRAGQEETLVGTARALATALHERPRLFDNSASYLSDVKPGTDLYAHKIVDPIQLDGRLGDWTDYRDLALSYGTEQLLEVTQPYQPDSLRFEHMVGQYGDYLYAFFAVTDDHVVLRGGNSLRVDRNDHLQIALLTEEGDFRRYVVATAADGWVNAFLLSDNPASNRVLRPETRIQGYWRASAQGYNIELRLPLDVLSSKIAFAIADVDSEQDPRVNYRIGTANTAKSEGLGTVLVPSPEIEAIISGLQYSNARVWVLDKHRRVLARSGQIQQAAGFADRLEQPQAPGWWQHVEQQWLLPLYYRVLTKPPADFIDELENAFELEGQDIEQALVGNPDSFWRLSPDKQALILSASHPIWIDGNVMGAVVVEQTNNGIRSLRNKALEKLFHIILAVVGLGTLSLFLFASRISARIRKLRNETEAAIDSSGKIVGNIQQSKTADEIGDLSRTFYNVLDKLGQYNAYLENMASRLSHELRTPVAIVNSSLENLQMESSDPALSPYIRRAKEGNQRLSKILSNMSEATRLEHSLKNTEAEDFVINDVLSGVCEGYRLAYPQQRFALSLPDSPVALHGSPELFAQMLDKVVANAVEFSPEQGEIGLTLEKKGQEKRLLIDNLGPCLPANMQEELFDSMVSVRNTQAPGESHLGLGLYIAKLIADYHQGRLSIDNRPDGKGVRVTLTLK